MRDPSTSKVRFNTLASKWVPPNLVSPSRVSPSFATSSLARKLSDGSFRTETIQNGAFWSVLPRDTISSNSRRQHGEDPSTARRVIVIATRSFGEQCESGRIGIRYCDELRSISRCAKSVQVSGMHYAGLERDRIRVMIRPRRDLNHAGMSGEIYSALSHWLLAPINRNAKFSRSYLQFRITCRICSFT